jgi:hypothetical protein
MTDPLKKRNELMDGPDRERAEEEDGDGEGERPPARMEGETAEGDQHSGAERCEGREWRGIGPRPWHDLAVACDPHPRREEMRFPQDERRFREEDDGEQKLDSSHHDAVRKRVAHSGPGHAAD